MGWPLAIICRRLPRLLLLRPITCRRRFIHRGYDFVQIVDYFAFGTEGIYGTPVYVSAAYIFIFVVFAAFLERAGMIALFNDVALGLVGSWRGGPAQVCVLSSALMGTISGSGVANVVASGQFTIPLMKRFGFRSAFAGGVEATSSMGGQIMPPVMGAVAFIMAETLNVPYADVVKAAIIPAILYFGACFWQVHLEAGKAGLGGMHKDELPNPWDAVKQHWPLVLPLAALVYLLFAGYTPIFAGTMGLALTVVLILGAPLAALIGPFAFRVVFWIALGLAAAAFMRFGVNVLAAVIGALVVACLAFKGGRETLMICVDSLAEGAKNALPVGIACAIVGIVIGTLTLTGIASTLIGAIITIGENNLFLSLVLTMLTCLVLGMGIPTIPNYIITSSLAGPALLELGVPLLVSHMFVFYFGIMADLTPPVALAAFAAAPMAKEIGLKIGIQASKLAIAGFVVPFMAVYTPALMLQDRRADGRTASAIPSRSPISSLKACLGIVLWGAAVVGFLVHPAGRLGAPGRLRGRRAPGSCAAAHRRDRLGARGPLDRLALVAGKACRRAAMSLCILAAGKTTVLAVTAFTLSWTHSVEKTRWEEDWRVTPAGLEIFEARVKGSGAGIDPPEGAVLEDGWWTYEPRIGARPAVTLAASGATGSGWTLCADQTCLELGRRGRRDCRAFRLRRLQPALIAHDKPDDRQRNIDVEPEAALLADRLQRCRSSVSAGAASEARDSANARPATVIVLRPASA